MPEETPPTTGPERGGVSVIVVPRERSSVAADSLRSIYRNTGRPFELIYVDCLLPGGERAEVRRLVAEHGDRYLRFEEPLYPNEARNRGLAQAGGEHLVFVDNDLFVDEGWLDALVTCAEETGAGVVGPLYLEGDADRQVVHCAGGEIQRVEGPGGEERLVTRQYELGLPPEELPELEREPTGLIEFHCVLVTRPCLEAVGGTLDEGLETTREHVDLCLEAREAGFEVYLEPASRVLYGKDESLSLGDLRYFLFRWSAGATRRTIEHFEEKWSVRLDPAREEIIRNRRLRAVAAALGLDGLARAWIRLRDALRRRLGGAETSPSHH